jgi:hypothetical protein
MLADGGDCVSDLAALRGQQALFGKVASNATAWRVLGQLAPERLAGLRAARAQARPTSTRAICRRERAHPGAQLRLWEDEGLRHQVFITDQQDADIAVLEARHRCRAHVEDGIRCAKDTGLTTLPSAAFAFNQVWLDLVLTAQCLTAWMQALCLRGQARRWEPKRLRHRLFHTAARVVRTGRRVILRLQQSWPWATDLARAFTRLRTVPQAP